MKFIELNYIRHIKKLTVNKPEEDFREMVFYSSVLIAFAFLILYSVHRTGKCY